MPSTHTYVELEVSHGAYMEIWEALAKAGYHHAFQDGAIDMHGIALTKKDCGEPELVHPDGQSAQPVTPKVD